MKLKTGDFPDWDRSPVAFIRTCAVSQFVSIATTNKVRTGSLKEWLGKITM